jgi:hypothetical protein
VAHERWEETVMSAAMLDTRRAEASEMTKTSPQTWRRLYLVGGSLLVLSGIGGLVDWRLGAHLYPSGVPTTAAAYLQLISHSQTLANTLWTLWIVGDLILIVPTLAVYLALRRDNPTLALIGTLVAGLYIVYDISVTELNSLTLVSLSNSYANATTAAAQAPYVAAASYGVAALPLETVLSFGLGAIGYLIWSVVMLEGRTFPRWIAVTGILLNSAAIIGAFSPVVPAFYVVGVLMYFTIPLTGLWFVAVGVALYRHATKRMRLTT